jgi:hypothetical protein
MPTGNKSHFLEMYIRIIHGVNVLVSLEIDGELDLVISQLEIIYEEISFPNDVHVRD